MVASRDISPDEDLLLSYGKLDNTFLLLDYGMNITSVIYVMSRCELRLFWGILMRKACQLSA